MTEQEIERCLERLSSYKATDVMNFDYAGTLAYIKRLKSENAALRERLEKAVEFPYSISETVYYVCKISPHIYEICRGIIVELSIDKRGVIWTRAKYEDGSEYLHCSCNNFVNLYKTPEAAEERLKELKGEKQ